MNLGEGVGIIDVFHQIFTHLLFYEKLTATHDEFMNFFFFHLE